MSQKKKQFRFKIPWISSGASASSSHVPKQRSKSSSAQPDTNNVTKQRPPFRPPGIAPAPSPTSSVILESPSPVCSPPSTPSGVNSPSRLSSASSIEVAPPKPVTEEESTHRHDASTASEQEPSSSPITTKIQAVPSQPHRSPSHSASKHIEVLKESTLPLASKSSSQMDKKDHSEPFMKQESKPKMKLPLKKTVIPKELQLETRRESSNKSEAKEKIVVMQEPIKVGKGNDDKKQGKVKSTPRYTKDASTSTAAIRADRKKQKEAHESVESKMMFATSSASGKEDIKVVSNISPESQTSFVSTHEDKPHLQKGIKDEISNFVHKLATVNPTQPMDDNKNVSVVTLAGDNRGATMHVGYSHSTTKKEGSIRIHRAYKTINPEESSTDGGEENSGRSSMEEKDDEDFGKAYVNSNIQSVNNSMLLHGSITERDPGVRMILPQQPAEQPIIKPAETRKAAQVHINRSERLPPNRPVVRRRCLRGLFLEPSDSDPDKPRRHGCKFRCGDIGNNTEIM